jgi:hypothetical protein
MPINGDALRECGPEGEELFQELISLEARCNRLLKQHNTERIEALQVEHENLIVKQRELKEQYDALLVEQAQLTVNAGPVDTAVRQAASNLKFIQEQAPPEKYATRADIKAHNGRVAEAEKVRDKAAARQTAHNDRSHDWERRERAKREELAALDDRIESVWHELQVRLGNPVGPLVDRETGLVRHSGVKRESVQSGWSKK